MVSRLHPQFSSFIAFYSCSRPKSGIGTRSFSRRCLHFRSSPSRVFHPNRCVGYRRDFSSSSSNNAAKDPYQALGVKPDANAAEIKKAYFALARKYHPDTNPDKNAQEKFVEIQEAYDILKDEKKRAAYDQYGSASQQPGFDPNNPFTQGFAGNASGFQDFASAFGGAFGGGRAQSGLFDELFGVFGGAGRGRASNSRGENIEARINISFLDACKGTTRKVNISPVVNCGTCSGSGLKHGANRTTCTSCGGSGMRTYVIDSGFQMQSTCSSCDGIGSTIPRNGQCSSCGGVGKVRMKKTVDVTIPPGVEDGMSIRIASQGDAPISGKGPNGDLFVRVNVAQSKDFTRQGAHLYHEARIPMHTAILGGRVRVPTLDGNVDVRVPSGTQQGEEMVLKGRGVPRVYGGDNGDLFVTFSVQLPRTLTARQRRLLQAYADDVEGRVSSEPDPSRAASASSRGAEEASAKDLDNDDSHAAQDDTYREGEKKKATA